MNLNGIEGFKFEINFPENIFEETKILEWKFFDDSTLVSFGAFENSSLWVDSDYFERRIHLKANSKELSELGFNFTSSFTESSKRVNLQVFEDQ